MSPTVVAKRSTKNSTGKTNSTKGRTQTRKPAPRKAATRSAASTRKLTTKTKASKSPARATTKSAAKAAPKSAPKAAPKAAAKTAGRTVRKAPAGRITVKTTIEIGGRGAATRKVLVEDKPLSAAERKRREQERIDGIWKMYKKTGDENLRNILVEYHFPLVRYIAERLLQTLPKSIELDDLISAGTFGLMDAIRGFDLKRGIKFKTYCSTRIRGSILDELRSQDWVPRLVRLKAHKLDKAVRKLEARNGGDVNDYELAREMDLTLEELEILKTEASPKTIFSLSEKLDESDDNRDMEKVEIIEDKKGTDPLQSLHQQDVLDLITSNLTKKERLIIIMYYYEGLTMREIGDIMSLTESRVCQIHSNVMSRLKTQLKSLATEGSAI